ncbi:MAG: GRP family sugar transporter, partial [Candidatus Doudnabacteria bacterium]|nr:GRP family sugar transporter [Candidatus Doudnabacteria bacterium]
LLAFTGIADKFLVSKIVRQPIAYAFYTAVTGPFSLVLIPFGAKLLSVQNFLIAFASGIFFIAGVYNSYAAISRSSVSRVIPIQGGLVPLFSFLFAYLILGERLTSLQTLGFLFLVAGAVIISIRKEHGVWTSKAFIYAALSALFFALSSVLTKYTFDHSSFISGMVWTRVGFILPVPFILLYRKNREAIFKAPKEAGAKNVALYYSSRATGSVGGFLQNYAVSLGSVSVVNALQGIQFVFLLMFTSFFSVYFPKVLKEKISAETITLKLSAIALISCGLYLLFT